MRIFVFLLIVLLLVMNVHAGDYVGTKFGLTNDNDVFTENVVAEFNEKSGYNQVTFNDNGKFWLKQNGVKTAFENIKPNGKTTPAFIKLDSKGSIVEADFTINDKSGNYVIMNDKIYMPPNSRLVFKNGKVEIILPDNAKLEKTPVLVDSKKSGNTIEIKGNGISLPEGAVLNKGVVTYKDGAAYVVKGGYTVINGYGVNALKNDVELKFGKKSFFSFGEEKGNFVRFSEKVEINGDGFKVDFRDFNSASKESKSAYVNLPGRGYYQKGDNPKSAEEKKSIENIQKIVGASVDGNYGAATAAKVSEWQRKVYSETGVCVGKETAGGCASDGLFGEKSMNYALSYYDVNSLDKTKTTSKGTLSVSPHGGKAELYADSSGLKANFKGNVDVAVGNKQVSFDGKDVNKAVVKSIFNTEWSMPTSLTFYSGEGAKLAEMRTYGTDTFFSKDLTESKLPAILAKRGINANSVNCAGTVCSLFKEQGPEGVRYGGIFNPTLSGAAGVEGAAWEMSPNIQSRGGELIYAKEDYITPDQKRELESLREEVIDKYSKSGAKVDPSRKEAVIKSLSNEIREREGNILNKDRLSSQVNLDSGDVVGMYYKNSNYLAQALMDGKGDDFTQKNTHVGLVKSFKENTFDTSDVNSIKSKLGIKGDQGMYVNNYFVKLKDSDYFQPVVLKDKKFYLDDSELSPPEISQVSVRRPEIVHMIHYGSESNPYHLESFDKVLDREDISLYSVTRPSDNIKDKIVQARLDKESVVSSVAKLNCNPPECTTLSVVDRAKYKGVDKTVVDYVDKSDFSVVSSSQRDQFKAAILTAVEMESGGLKYYGHPIEKAVAKILGVNDYSQGTYTQIKPDTLAEAAKITGKNVKSLDLNTDEGSLKATTIVMEAIFKKYIPPDKKTLTPDDMEVIGSAWNNGINSEYTQKLAKKQYSSLPKVEPRWVKGEFARYYAKLSGYDTSTYFSAYPSRFRDSFKTYCC
jgi:hypothetical protein